MTGRSAVLVALTVVLLGSVAAACGPAAPANASPSGAAWSRHDLGSGPPIADVVPGGPGLLGTAGDPDAGGGIWSSADGVAWTAVAPPVSGRLVTAIAAGDGRFVAVGSQTGQDGSRAAVLISSDGTTWTAVPDAPELGNSAGTGNAEMQDVAFSGGVWVAVGVEYGPTGQHGALWTSSDGTTWRHTSAGDSGSRLSAVAAAGPGFIAVGEARVPSGQFASTILASSDGIVWTGVADMAPFDSALATTLATADGLTVIGGTRLDPQSGAARPAFWTSTDGVGWDAATVDDARAATGGSDGQPDFFEGGIVTSVTPTPGGWVAAGTGADHWVEAIALEIAIWSSPDGRAWRRGEHSPILETGLSTGLQYGARSIVAWDGRLIITGATDAAPGTVWLSPPQPGGTEPSPRPAPPTPEPTDPGGGTPATPAPPAPAATAP